MALQWLPDYPPISVRPTTPTTPTTPIIIMQVAPRATLASVARQPSQLQLAADSAPLRITYGRDRIGALIADALMIAARQLVLLCVWGEGEIDGIELIEIDDQAAPYGVTMTHYTGTAGQTVNSTLVAAYAAQSPPVTFNDAMPGVAYSVIAIPAGIGIGFPRVTARLRGRKLYDPRTTLTAYSANPALALADFLRSTKYGMGLTVDDVSVGEAAAACDGVVGGSARRAIGLTLATPQTCRDWIEALRTYAGCFVVQAGDVVKLVPDRPRATDATLAHASGQILRIGALKKRGVAQSPSALEVRYTDTSISPWRDAGVTVMLDGVSGGTVARRDSVVRLPGIQTRAQALREATERINKLTLSDLSFEVEVFDEMLKLEVGDVVAVTHPIGLTDKPMRILNLTGDLGRYKLSLSEYDPNAYSDEVIEEATYDDTSLASPFVVPSVSALTATEEVYQTDIGTYASRLKLAWTEPDYPYFAYYRIRVANGPSMIDASTTVENEYRTPPVQESVTYQVSVTTVSSLGIESTAAVRDVTALGKLLVPGNVSVITGFEAGGIVFLSWAEAIDLDIWQYELRYGLTSGSWDTASIIDRIDGLRYTVQTMPPGTWRFYVKAIDAVGQYSTTAATLDLVVTSDVNSFLVDRYDQTAPTLTGMTAYSLNRHDGITHWVTEDNVAAGTKYSNTMSTYTNPLAAYHNSISCEWLGEAEDFGQDLSGDWTGESTASALSGTVTLVIGTKTAAAGSYTYASTLTAKTTARYARLRHQSATTSTLHVQSGEAVRLNAVPREEVGTGNSLTSAPVTVTLTGKYSAAKKIVVTPEGNTARMGLYDNVVLSPTGINSFDVHIFDANGARMISPFRYSFQGV